MDWATSSGRRARTALMNFILVALGVGCVVGRTGLIAEALCRSLCYGLNELGCPASDTRDDDVGRHCPIYTRY
jgi:hypothetical protein